MGKEHPIANPNTVLAPIIMSKPDGPSNGRDSKPTKRVMGMMTPNKMAPNKPASSRFIIIRIYRSEIGILIDINA